MTATKATAKAKPKPSREPGHRAGRGRKGAVAKVRRVPIPKYQQVKAVAKRKAALRSRKKLSARSAVKRPAKNKKMKK